MHIRTIDNGLIVRLVKGEEFVASIQKLAQDHNIQSAFFYGLGGAQSAQLSIYRYDTDNQYHPKDFDGPLEIMNVTGNIARKDGEVALHAHATISGADLLAYGGHVQSMVIAGTCELYFSLQSTPMTRTLDESIGLALLDLS